MMYDDRFSIFYCDTGEYSDPMSLEEAKYCTKLFSVAQYIVDLCTGEVMWEA